MDTIAKLTELSPPVLLALALYLFGRFLKRSPVADWMIPFILIAAGAAVNPLVAEVGKVSYNVQSPVAFNALIGACIGGLAVAGHQGAKQFMANFRSNDNSTTFTKKEPNA